MWWCAAILAITAALTACTGSATPRPTHSPVPTTPSTSAAPSSTAPPAPVVPTTGPNVRPGERPPTLPAVGHEDKPIGADFYARYWIETLDWGYATTSSALARTAFSPVCTGCARFVTTYDLTSKAGDHFVGGRSSITSSAIADNDKRNGAQYAVDITISVAPLKTVDAKGAAVSSAKPLTITFRNWLAWRGVGFTVVDFKQVVMK
ncbi:DUF6318 family protein [uncultured Jatrophihabitans sp.]|uniref:DUF6318 family protein n=1 Tax=uncultured Jatrophihabitans sp. TaxID=1610747 RepID=UPI0035CA41E7